MQIQDDTNCEIELYFDNGQGELKVSTTGESETPWLLGEPGEL